MSIFDISFELILFRIKITAAVLSLIFAGLAAYFITQFWKLVGIKIEMNKLALRTQKSAYGGAGQSRWEEILRHINSEKEAEWKLAVIEADKLIDSLLKQAGYHGDTMGDRLMNIEKGRLIGLEGLWEAHKIRNKLVHDSNYFLRYSEAKQAIMLYEAALKELELV